MAKHLLAAGALLSVAATPIVSSTAVAQPGACAAELSAFRALVDGDLKTGHVAKSVHAWMSAEIDRAAAACAGGRDAEALRMLDATKGRYGYR